MAQRDGRMIAALLRERDAYVRQDKPDRVAQVDAELRRNGHNPEAEQSDPSGDPPRDRSADGGQQQTDATSPPAETPIGAAADQAAEAGPGTGPEADTPAAAKKTALPRRTTKSKS